MEINETLIKEYAKKILGFAYSKTQNHSEAQDLSQDILLQLCRIDFTSKNIENMDGYIYRVCQYTWSNFVRKNICAWNTAEYDELSAVASGETPDGDVIRSELYARLRQEIMYLGKGKRDAVVLFYYEGKSGSKISQILNVPASTVRWYLSESRKILKERIEMVEGIYSPIRLKVFYNGSCNESTMAGLGADLLVENICIVCAKKALSIEEIARTMGMSAAFIENKLDGLLNMNYIEKTGAGKYRTTFYIKDRDFIFVQKKI